MARRISAERGETPSSSATGGIRSESARAAFSTSTKLSMSPRFVLRLPSSDKNGFLMVTSSRPFQTLAPSGVKDPQYSSMMLRREEPGAGVRAPEARVPIEGGGRSQGGLTVRSP